MQSKSKISISWWLVLVQAFLARYVRVDQEWIRKVRDASAKGHIVFVMRNRSLIDFICLRSLCHKYDLPPVSFVSGLTPLFYLPLWRYLLSLFRRKSYEELSRELTDALEGGGSALIFLRKPARPGALGSQPVDVDGIKIALGSQSMLNLSLLALPTVFLWGELAMKRFPSTMDFIFGSNEYPRLGRSIWILFRRKSVHQLMVGTPISFLEMKHERKLEDDSLAGVIRAGVGRQIEELRRSKLGSLTKPSSRLKREVLRSPRLHAELAVIGAEDGMSEQEIERKAASALNKLAADFKPRVLSFLSTILTYVWKRIYTGIEVSDDGMERMRAVLAKGPTLILPTHKSHIDYIVISQVMQDQNTMMPHIAAGQNLAFWPLGWIFRSSGAFFIRRRFLHDRFYTTIVNAYVRHLLKEKNAIEIFIEGTRSRTGKLLRPKLGMIEMALKAQSMLPQMNIQVLPVSIGYEHVIEENEYVKEARGESKTKENIKGLLKTTKVLFSRYGRLYVMIGEPFSTADVLGDLDLTAEELDKGAVRRQVATEMAIRNFHEINRITVVTPSAVLATALLTGRAAHISHEELRKSAMWLVDFLRNLGANLSPFLLKWRENSSGQHPDDDLLDQAISVWVDSGRIRINTKDTQPAYRVRTEQRLSLDYYKNNIIHFFVPASLVCASCLANGGKRVDKETIVRDIMLACRLYRWEFIFRADPSDDETELHKEAVKIVSEALQLLAKLKIVTSDDNHVAITHRQKAFFVSDILRGFHEIYFATICATKEKALSGANGNSQQRAKVFTDKQLAEGRFFNPETYIRLNIQTAVQSIKEMKIISAKANAFEEGQQGDRVHRYLKAIIDLQ
jgi:glycerol-3-phosphate O-acyltransferase